MKNFLYKSSMLFMLALSMFIMTSCEDEGEGGGADASSKLIGTWTMTDSEISAKIGGVDVVQFLMAGMQLTEDQAKAMFDAFTSELKNSFNGTITFKDDNTYALAFPDKPSDNESGTWRVSDDGKKLYTKITGETEEDDMTIHTLTASMLIVKWSEEEMVDLDDDDVDETAVDMEITLTLTK